MNEWISVDDRLPVDEWVLTWNGGLIDIGYLDLPSQEWNPQTTSDLVPVTHWMPLPEPPEVKP